jgi:hypothetical protein
MVELSLIPDRVLDAARNRGLSDETIASQTPEELFDVYLSWLGIVGHSKDFIKALDSLRYAKKAE